LDQKMNKSVRLLASASVLAASAIAAAPAFAAGTTAGTSIQNTVTLDYKVGGVDQSQLTTSDTFTVDRKVTFTVSEVGTSSTTVSPGQVTAVTTFLVSNASNASLDVALAVSQPSGGTAAHGGTDNFNVTGPKTYVDTNTNGTYDAGTDVEITYLDQLAADDSKTVFVVVSVPLGRATGDVAGVRLTGTASEAATSGTLGSTIAQSTGANTSEMDTVFADTNASGNTARDGIHFAEDDYTVLAASITATKTSRVVSDPVNGTTDPKMIPGAVVEYCITVANAAGSAIASGITISDLLPGETTYDAAFGIKLNGTVTGGTCNPDGASGGSYASGTVSGSLADLPGGATRTLVFRVSVN
jgi:hypothetical protein